MVIIRARQETIWIAPKKFQKFLRRLALLTFLIRVQAFPVVFQDYLVNLISNLRGGNFWVVQDEAHHRWKNHHV